MTDIFMVEEVRNICITQADESLFLDVDKGLKNVRGNTKLYTKLLGLFMECTEPDDFLGACRRGELKVAHLALHSLKGIAGNLAMPELFSVCARLLEVCSDETISDQEIVEFASVSQATTEIAKQLYKRLNGTK